MELNWFQSLLYGLLSGLTEFLPISAQSHRTLYLTCLGISQESPMLRLGVHLGCFAAVVLSCLPLMTKIHREKRLSTIPRERRKRPVDMRMIRMRHFVSVAAVPVLLGIFASPYVSGVQNQFWLLALLLALNGIFLLMPQHMPQANKDSLSLTSADALLMGLAGAAGAIPGISRVGMLTSVGLMRGAERRHALDLTLLLSIPALAALAVLDCAALFSTGAGGSVLLSLLAAVSAFGSAYGSIFIMRFLAFKIGFSGFAYYSWGAALFTFILYLIV